MDTATLTAPTPTPVAVDSVDRLVEGLADALGQRLGRREVGVGYRHDPSGSPTTTGFLHGPGGHLRYPGVDPDVFHTIVGSRGLIGQLPARASVDSNPLFAVITGVDDATGEEKTEVCADAKTVGVMRSCMLSSVFGRYERQTAQLELNRLGLRTDRADPMDLRLVGSPIAQAGIFNTGPAGNNVPGDVLTNEMSARMFELSVAFHNLLARQLWTGNPANNNGDAYREVTSFSLLVNTGHADVLTNTSCPSVDSDVKDFQYQSVDSAGSELVEALTYMFRFVRDLAERTGVTPVRWVFVMRPQLFYEISAVWPCAYLTYRCTFDSDAARLIVDGAEQVRMRDEMRAGSYLLIDGIRVEVVVDDGIPITTSTDSANVPEGSFASDIYLIPMSILGGRAVTYLEYMDFNNPSIQAALANIPVGSFTVDGPWITTAKFRNWCIQWQSKIEPRLILRTPWLAGRLQNVVSTNFQMTRSPFPDDPYHVAGGGVSERPGPSYYTPLWGS